jgi:photosystem II stability/assembly factor-like uncharacterized protein
MIVDLSGQWEIVRDTVYPKPPGRAGPKVDKDVCFINRDKGFIISSVPFRHSRTGLVSMTNDGGITWNDVFTVPGAVLRTCIFTGDLIGFVNGSGLYQTSDGGSAWVKNDNELPVIIDIFFVDEHTGFAASDSSINKTVNGGGSWERILNCNTCNLNSIFFIDESNGWVVGEMGLIMKLTEGGKWETIASGTTLPLNKVFFADNYTGWIAGGYRNSSRDFHPVLLKTGDGGGSWSKVENVNCLIHDLYFKNDIEGWAVGEDNNGKGIIIETIDGGNNWSVQVDSLRVPLAAIDFKDGYGWALGNGLILKLDSLSMANFRSVPAVCVDAAPFNLTQGSPAGGTYSGPGIVTSPQFDPATAGVGTHTITYTYTNLIGITSSATQNITVNALTAVIFGPISEVCLDAAAFKLVQGSPPGGIYSGTGITTSPQFDPSIAGVGTHTITYTYNNGCLNSANQTITVFDSTNTAIKEDDEKLNSNSILFQNYPNPFSLRTVIGYQFPVISNIELNVYDITGRKVTTLVKEQQPAGSYEVEWNAEGMTQGIYFCELKAGQNRKIIKMILLK